jgi:hypothetical protein
MDVLKIIKKLPTGYADEAAAMDGDKLRAEIVKAEGALHECDRLMEDDEKLQAAKLIAKDLGAGYRDARKAQRAKIAYVLYLLEEKCEPAFTGFPSLATPATNETSAAG